MAIFIGLAFIWVCKMVVGITLSALVFQFGWNTFISPLGVVEIALAHAYGIAVLVSMLVINSTNAFDDKTDANDTWVKGISIKLAAWLLLYIASLFM